MSVQRYLLGLSVLLLAACSAGSGRGLDAAGRPIGETPAPDDSPTLANIQARVFTPICIQCHIGAAAPQGLRLDSANAFNDLVGVASREVPSLARVEAFSPDNSYLVQKIEGSAAVGARMPLGGPPLPVADIQLIRQWIADGAMPDPMGVADAMPAVSGAQFQTLESSGRTQIRLAFSHKVDQTTVHVGSVLLTQSFDDVFGNYDDLQVSDYTATPSAVDPYIVLIELPDAGVNRHWYRLTLGAASSSVLLDTAGRAVADYTLEWH